MESIFAFICEHAFYAPGIFFLLLLLTGINFPISEDLIILSAGAMASSCIPEHTLLLYFSILLGCYASAWEGYWLGRLLGPKLYKIRLLSYVITPERLDILRQFYARFGIYTFLIGRFCPGGVRNVLFISSGLTKMPFSLFLLRDGLAALLYSSIIFTIGYKFGENLDQVLYYFHRYAEFAVIALVSIIFCVVMYVWYRHYKGI
jgi:membrane protein DedA with SNARE-associated domain